MNSALPPTATPAPPSLPAEVPTRCLQGARTVNSACGSRPTAGAGLGRRGPNSRNESPGINFWLKLWEARPWTPRRRRMFPAPAGAAARKTAARSGVRCECTFRTDLPVVAWVLSPTGTAHPGPAHRPAAQRCPSLQQLHYPVGSSRGWAWSGFPGPEHTQQ